MQPGRFERMATAFHVFLLAGLNDYGRDVTKERLLVYAEGLKGLNDAQLERGLGLVISTMSDFPAVAEIIALSKPEEGEIIVRRNANCTDCDGTGWTYVDPADARRGVRACDCRPAPPEGKSPPTPVEGLEREIRLVAEGMKL